jgi:hypothetical protein
MELFTATGNLKKIFLGGGEGGKIRDVRCVHHGWHGTHRCDIQILATHASTWVLSAWHRHPISVSCLYDARMVLSVGGSFCVLCTRCTLHSNHRLTVWYSNTQNDFSHGAAIFSSPSGRNVNYDEEQLTAEKISEFLLAVQVSKILVLRVSYNKFL